MQFLALIFSFINPSLLAGQQLPTQKHEEREREKQRGRESETERWGETEELRGYSCILFLFHNEVLAADP